MSKMEEMSKTFADNKADYEAGWQAALKHDERISKITNLIRASRQVCSWFTPDNPEHPVSKLRYALDEYEKSK